MHLDKEMLKAYRTFESLEGNLTQEEIWENQVLYKQAMNGDNATPQPRDQDVQGRARWDIWNSKKGMPKEEARETFLSNVKSIEAKYSERA
ncbi:hypothetical protein N7467_006287 [Penicillium canescens]|nr:hypothetical protein N7467_006287 [Penicillium canescens]